MLCCLLSGYLTAQVVSGRGVNLLYFIVGLLQIMQYYNSVSEASCSTPYHNSVFDYFTVPL